jgi:hypothetical protein
MFVRVRMGVADPGVAVGMYVEMAPAPPQQESHRQDCDQQANDDLRPALNRLRQVPAKEQNRKTEAEQSGGVAQSPGHPKQRRATGAVASIGQKQGGHSRQVIRIGRVPKAKQNGHDEGHDAAAAEIHDPLIQVHGAER